ncbi:MAG: hypothetical protein HMLIMOIP_001283 [Candidatus Nitrosomirales archaeon]|jgi:hypothetical protein
MKSSQNIIDRISDIRGERDVEKRLRKLQRLNESLPEGIKLEMPSLITNAYVRRALDIIEDRIALMSSRGTTRSQA